MSDDGAKFSDGVDRDKLLVEVVQGLLMAHARLDRMENTLRQAVETASLKHLNSFDKSLRDIDVRFQQTTSDAGKAVTSLKEVRVDLIRSVQGSSEHHLDAYNKQVHNIQGTLSSNLAATKDHQNYLTGRLQTHLNTQAEATKLETAKQADNWKNLQIFLNDLQSRLGKANAETITVAHNNTLTITEKLQAVESHLQGMTTQLAGANRRLLIWLIVLSAISLLLSGAMIYKMFVH